MQMFPETQMENTTSFMTKRLVLQQSCLVLRKLIVKFTLSHFNTGEIGKKQQQKETW